MKIPSPCTLALASLVALGMTAAVRGADGPSDEWRLPSESAVLRPGKGRELVLGQCVVCHSADYVSTQPPLARAVWTATVEKMRGKYGAPVPTNTVPALVDYLVSAYGKPDAPR